MRGKIYDFQENWYLLLNLLLCFYIFLCAFIKFIRYLHSNFNISVDGAHNEHRQTRLLSQNAMQYK